MSISDAYSNWSSTYDKDVNRTRDLDQQITQASLAGQRFPHIVEIGCGTGKNSLFYASLADHLLGIDFSAGMLERARQKVVLPHVTFVEADLQKRWPVASGSVDLVACNLVLEHIADLAPIFEQVARCLDTGGQFFVSELHPAKQYLGSQAQFQRNGVANKVDAFVHHLSDFLTTAEKFGLTLIRLDEWWHEADDKLPPRLVSFRWRKL